MNTILLTACLTISFVMRNTSPIGWIPLIIIKIFDGALIPFIISGVTVFLPMVGLSVYLDSLFYWQKHGGQFECTFTSYNFLKVNVLQNLSKYFGDHGHFVYLTEFIPKDIFRL